MQEGFGVFPDWGPLLPNQWAGTWNANRPATGQENLAPCRRGTLPLPHAGSALLCGAGLWGKSWMASLPHRPWPVRQASLCPLYS